MHGVGTRHCGGAALNNSHAVSNLRNYVVRLRKLVFNECYGGGRRRGQIREISLSLGYIICWSYCALTSETPMRALLEYNILIWRVVLAHGWYNVWYNEVA